MNKNSCTSVQASSCTSVQASSCTSVQASSCTSVQASSCTSVQASSCTSVQASSCTSIQASMTTTMGAKSYVISLFDTAGQEEYIHLRALSYVNSDVFLLCFSVATPESLRDAQDKWIPEIRKYCPNTPVILVGTQIDLRDESPPTKPQRSTTKGPPVFIGTKEGVHAASKMNLDCYVECSSLTEAGISRLREAAIESGLRKVDTEETGCKCSCAIL
ncbi:hypothetical protein Btru_047003 [Bulinus truncatus]|nr:hypothetical protein Btru_047003 [Bulinus truncatus]